MTRRTYDPSTAMDAVNRLLAKTTNPHHRAILENNRLHGLLEITGRWEQILVPELTVDHPHYCYSDGQHTLVFDGRDEVASFYHGLKAGNMYNLLGPLDEELIVGDRGLAGYGLWGFQLTGPMAKERGHDVDDLDAHYYMTENISYFWPYTADAKLIGENIMEDPGTRTFWKMDPADVRTCEQNLEVLEPMLKEVLAARS